MTNRRYANQTTVSSNQTMTDIQNLLDRYECKDFVFGRSDNRAMVAFKLHERRIQFTLPLPSEDDDEFLRTPSRRQRRAPDSAKKAYDQAIRQRWRALLLTIKAKLESVESNIETFDEAFMAQLLLPNGKTMGEWAIPQIEQIYLTGDMPPLLPEST